MAALATIGGAAALIGGAAALMGATVLTPPSGDYRQQVSYYNLKGDPYTDKMRGIPTPWMDTRNGSNTLTHRMIDLREQKYMGESGELVSVPPGTANITGAVFMEGFAINPGYYNTRTLVMEARQGRVGAGNTLNINGLNQGAPVVDLNIEVFGDGTGAPAQYVLPGAAGYAANQIHVYVDGLTIDEKLQADVDYTVADSSGDLVVTLTAPTGVNNVFLSLVRREWVITNAASAGNLINSLSIGGDDTHVQRMMAGIFFKDEEADYRAQIDEPYKAITPGVRNWLKPNHVLRAVDLFGPTMMNSAVHPRDMARPTDQTLLAVTLKTTADQPWEASSLGGVRQANCTRILLDLCANGYATARTPVLNLPFYMGSPVSPSDRQYLVSDGLSQADCYFSSEIDWSTITLNNVSAPNGSPTVTIDPIIGKFTLDCSSMTHTGPEAQVDVTFDALDFDGDPVTFTVPYRVIPWAPAGTFLMKLKTGELWRLNRAYFEAHTAFRAWAKYIIDELRAVGFPSSVEVLIALANEIWNFEVTRFESDTLFAQGVGSTYGFTSEKNAGHGYLLARLKDEIDAEQAAQGTNFNIRIAVESWMAVPDTTSQKLKGYKYYWETVKGLAGQALLDKQAEARVFVTNYFSGQFFSNTANADTLAFSVANNMTGLTGTAHRDAIAAYFPSNTAQLTADVRAWYLAQDGKTYTLDWIINQIAAHKAIAATFNTDVDGSYEGENHDNYTTENVPSDIRAITGFDQWYDDFWQGQNGADIWTELVSRIAAAYPGFIISHYGGPYEFEGGQSWAKGWYQAPPTLRYQAIINTGIQE